jgi:hypothetical protein
MLDPVSHPSTAPDAVGRPGVSLRVRGWVAPALGAAIALGFFIRAAHVLSAHFPLNDGALFYLMTRELQEAHYRLPAFTTYNQAGIPYAYSPFGFYVAGLVADVTRLSLLDVFRFLPLAGASLTVVAFALLARAMLASGPAIVAGTVAFALVPRSYLWQVMGGGVARSLGFLFAILALHQVYLLYRSRSQRHIAPATVFAALTVLSHLGTAPFVAFSSALFFLFYGRHRQGVLGSAVIAVGTLVLTAPWWGAVLATHGLSPFGAASATGGNVVTADRALRGYVLLSVARFGLGTSEPLFPLIGALGVIGALACLRPGRALLPTWWLTIVLLEARAGATYAAVPLSMMAGVAVADVIIPLVRNRAVGASPAGDDGGRPAVSFSRPSRDWPVAAVLGFLLVYGIANSLTTKPELRGESRWLVSLTPDERAAMQWVAQQTPASSRFAVIIGPEWGGWWSDRFSEWFPVLANRVSVATVQGYEWLPDKMFARRWGLYDQLQGCANWLVSCLDDWSKASGASFTHVYIPKSPATPCCALLTTLLRDDSRYTVAYDGPGAIVFARR